MKISCNYRASLHLTFCGPEFLKVRSHDSEEAIRHDVIVSIVTAAKKDLSLVNDQLLNFVRERMLDKRVSPPGTTVRSCHFIVTIHHYWSLSQ